MDEQRRQNAALRQVPNHRLADSRGGLLDVLQKRSAFASKIGAATTVEVSRHCIETLKPPLATCDTTQNATSEEPRSPLRMKASLKDVRSLDARNMPTVAKASRQFRESACSPSTILKLQPP